MGARSSQAICWRLGACSRFRGKNQHAKSYADRNLNAIPKLLTCERLLKPSKLAAKENGKRHPFRCELDYDVYRELMELDLLSECIAGTRNSSITKNTRNDELSSTTT